MFTFITQFAQANAVLEIGNFTVNIWGWNYFFIAVKYLLMFYSFVIILDLILVFSRIQDGFKIRMKEAIEEAIEAGKLPRTKTQRKWDAVVSSVESNNPEDYKEAVVLAEKLFDYVLRSANFSGENLKKRLEKVPDNQMDFKEDIIWAYSLKEAILSDSSFEVDHEEAKRAVYVFQRALKEWGVL